MNKFVRTIIYFNLFLFSFCAQSQEKVKTTTFVYNTISPSFKPLYSLKCIMSKDYALLSMTYLGDTALLKNEKKIEQDAISDTIKMTMTLKRYPTVSLINRTTGELWLIWEQENGKVAVKQKDLKPEYVFDTNSNYILDYQNEYKTIGKYRCQNVKVTNKATKEIHFCYVTNIPEGTFYKMPYETGIQDVLVQSYDLKNALSLSLVSITNDFVSSDLFKFSKDTNVFDTPEDYGKWGRKYFESLQKQENN
ncbi:hypothetical protein [Pedobacter frigoris]|uniref:hypothetical protein n=1 Tax=Pedobacter frigoris TaxID=2571272 RepID=UPI00292FB4AE|nr:hypothetical protein [Pedobacter frigoris]